MAVDRRVLKSISEWSMFKYLLVAYLIFFIIFSVIFGAVAIIAWLGLATYGINLQDLLGEFGVDLTIFGGGVVSLIILLIIGLIASVFFAVGGVLFVWLINVALKVTGGIELRFFEKELEK